MRNLAQLVKIRSINKVNNFEKTLQENTQAGKDLKQETQAGFKAVNRELIKYMTMVARHSLIFKILT